MATFPQTAKCQDDTFIFNLQRHMWLYLCAQCPISEICLMPAVHPGKAQLDVIRAGAGKASVFGCLVILTRSAGCRSAFKAMMSKAC